MNECQRIQTSSLYSLHFFWLGFCLLRNGNIWELLESDIRPWELRLGLEIQLLCIHQNWLYCLKLVRALFTDFHKELVSFGGRIYIHPLMTASFLSQCWSTENVGSAAYLWPSIEPWQYNGPILWLIHGVWYVSSSLTDGSVVSLLSNSLLNIYRTILQIDPALPLEFYAWISGPGRISTWSAERGEIKFFFQKFSETHWVFTLQTAWDHAYSSSILYGKQNVILKTWSDYYAGRWRCPPSS